MNLAQTRDRLTVHLVTPGRSWDEIVLACTGAAVPAGGQWRDVAAADLVTCKKCRRRAEEVNA